MEELKTILKLKEGFDSNILTLEEFNSKKSILIDKILQKNSVKLIDDKVSNSESIVSYASNNELFWRNIINSFKFSHAFYKNTWTKQALADDIWISASKSFQYLIESCFILSGEYLVICIEGSLLTNYRLITMVDNTPCSIPLENITFYSENGQMKYMKSGKEEQLNMSWYIRKPVVQAVIDAREYLLLNQHQKETLCYNVYDLKKQYPNLVLPQIILSPKSVKSQLVKFITQSFVRKSIKFAFIIFALFGLVKLCETKKINLNNNAEVIAHLTKQSFRHIEGNSIFTAQFTPSSLTIHVTRGGSTSLLIGTYNYSLGSVEEHQRKLTHDVGDGKIHIAKSGEVFFEYKPTGEIFCFLPY